MQARTLSEIRKNLALQLKSGDNFAFKITVSLWICITASTYRECKGLYSGIGIIFTNYFCHFKNLLMLAQYILAWVEEKNSFRNPVVHWQFLSLLITMNIPCVLQTWQIFCSYFSLGTVGLNKWRVRGEFGWLFPAWTSVVYNSGKKKCKNNFINIYY